MTYGPPAALFGEITPDQTRIVLIAQGTSYDLKDIGGRLKHITPLIEKAKPESSKLVTIPATWPAVTQVAHSFPGDGTCGPRWVPGPRLSEWIIAELTRRTAPSPLNAGYPPWLKLRDYQEAGAAMIAAAGRFLLCDEPGLGKTAETIAGLAERENRGIPVFPMVIIVPGWDVADVWQREISSWAPQWADRVILHGGPGRAGRLDPAGLHVTTYATAAIDATGAADPLCQLRPAAVVLDEAHYIKSQQARRSQAARRLARHASTVVALTGTPITRDTGDLWPALNAIDPVSWPSRERFVKRYCQTADDPYGEAIEGLNRLAEPEFRFALTGTTRRVAKADVLDQLPPKVYSLRRVELPPEWRSAYDGMEKDMLAGLPDGTELEVMDFLSQLTRLSQLASSAADVTVTETIDEATGLTDKHTEVTLKAPSWKADALLDILAERTGQPVLVFAVSRQLITIAGLACQKAGYRTGYITGGMAKGTRIRAIADFQAGELDVILATTGAGGTGITLTAAGTVVFLQRPWSLAESVQAEDRAHRLGSEIHDCIEIIDVLAKDTVDTRVREALREKGRQLADFVQDPRLAKELLGGLS